MFKKQSIKTFLLKALKTILIYGVIAMGAMVSAFAIDTFLVPNNVVPGGVSGLSAIIHFISNKKISMGTAMIVLNIPLFIFGWRVLGVKFIVRTIFATVVMSLSIDLMEPLVATYALPFLQNGSNQDLMLFAIVGGVIEGTGLGLVIKNEATTGGSDLLATTMNRLIPGVSVGNLLLIIDFFVVITAMITFKSVLLGLYSLIAIFLSSRVIDIIVEGISFSKAFYIFSDKTDEIADRILAETGRGMTYLKGVGVYTGQDKNILLCVVQRAQLQKIKNIVKSIDRRAFVMLIDTHEVLGEGFRELK